MAVSRLVFAVLACTGVAFAQDAVDDYFGITGSFVDPDSQRFTDERGQAFDLFYGRSMLPNLFGELRFASEIHDTGNSQGSDNYRYGLSLEANYRLPLGAGFAAFALAGGGVAYNDLPGSANDDTNLFADIGGGVLSPELTKADMQIRVEARARYEDFGPGMTDFRFGLGAQLPIGRQRTVVKEVIVEVPASAPATAATDGPQVPRTNYPPRPVDVDRDGVLDNFDSCPGTVSGALVDASGCQVSVQAKDLSLRGVSFYPNSHDLTPAAQTALDVVAQALGDLEGRDVLVAGHTDSQGPENDNLVLSLARANSVKRYLTQRGVAAKRLKVVGYGESRPVASNATSEGRARNRRVELQLDAQLDPK